MALLVKIRLIVGAVVLSKRYLCILLSLLLLFYIYAYESIMESQICKHCKVDGWCIASTSFLQLKIISLCKHSCEYWNMWNLTNTILINCTRFCLLQNPFNHASVFSDTSTSFCYHTCYTWKFFWHKIAGDCCYTWRVDWAASSWPKYWESDTCVGCGSILCGQRYSTISFDWW